MSAGRPLRFIGGVAVTWICWRAAFLWPVVVTSEEVAREETRPAPVAWAGPGRPLVANRVPAELSALDPIVPIGLPDRSVTPGVDRSEAARDRIASSTSPIAKTQFASSRSFSNIAAPPVESGSADMEASTVPPLVTRLGSVGVAGRISGSAWTIVRGAGAASGLNTSQLGGSQAGARLAYAIGSGRLAVVGRIATPLSGVGREAALGAEVRMAGGAVRLFAERRFALGGGRGGTSAGVISGLDRPVVLGARVQAYGQAGAIARDAEAGRAEGFIDAAARLTRPVASVGGLRLDLGVGGWGGAQRGAARVDFGPTLGVAVPVAGRTLRLSVDWRQRVVGRARPGSGPALSVGTDF